MIFDAQLRHNLAHAGAETFHGDGAFISDTFSFEAPCGIKSMEIHHESSMGAFSYGVSGFFSETSIGRYCSMGEGIQCGRGAHPTSWLSTSPFFYCHGTRMFDLGTGFSGWEKYHDYQPTHPVTHPHVSNGRNTPNFIAKTVIGNDVWIGHASFIGQGLTIGDGAVIAGHSVVTKNVPPFAIVGGNPAQIIGFRFDPRQIGKLLDLAWWRFTPWDLRNIDYSNIDAAIERLQDVSRNIAPYQPGYVNIKSLK
ncbi:CatB-related O-acetyltransferase [Methylobacterium indicum]|uniref:CatB-related O-acetyltransferase n=1 Tax=Methylobacterium indicum TaxID=1775910 RepID=UPI0009E29ED2|nr:CatB-related O-acetyltransferase [Methylobacterium indicum]